MKKALKKTAGGATLMDGNVVAEKVQAEIAASLANNPAFKVTLATVLIGDSPASKLYVGMKQRRAAAVGIQSKHVKLAENV
ncbi:MAG: tetrahydrofolate dehydrogenase/cyclohydrolase catalytic domain-containing protein, partial [Gammaproteobacteria bacterium]